MDQAHQFHTLADKWELDVVRAELLAALEAMEPLQRPHVPTQLLRSIDMFLDSYGQHLDESSF